MQKNSDLPYVNVPETIGLPPQKEQTEKIVRLVADRVLKRTTYRFLNKRTGQRFENSTSLPVSADIVLESGYNDWKYWNGVIHLAMLELWRSTGDEKYKNYVQKNYEFAFSHLDFFKKLFDAQIPNANFHQFFRLDRLDDFGAMGAGLIETLEFDNRPEYNQYIGRVSQYIKNQQDRLPDGTFARNRFGKTTLWADDLYMSVPFLVRMGQFSGEKNYIDDAVQQVINFDKKMHNPTNGLNYHTWYKQLNTYGVAYWGRANGWLIMGECELLNRLPKDHPKRDELIGILFRQLVGISRYQSASGMWHQLLDKTDSFEETSSTAMFVYGFAKAINLGWIDDIYSSVALSGWKGLMNQIKADGEVDNVSTGFNIKQDLAYYYKRPIEKGGDHGLGAVLLAGIEVMKLKEYRDCVWC